MIIYRFKNNPIGAAVSEILRYKNTDKQTNILLLYYKDCLIYTRRIFYKHNRIKQDSNQPFQLPRDHFLEVSPEFHPSLLQVLQDICPFDNQPFNCTTFVWKSKLYLVLSCACFEQMHSPYSNYI